jgi:hypothetical protein
MQGSNLPPKAIVPIFDIAVLCNIFSRHISASLEVDVVAVISTTICLQVKWFLIMYGVFAAWGHAT